MKAAPTWLQELVESHESLPWQRRGYLREALLDQLTSKAGFAPMEMETTSTAEEEQDSVREFLDQQRSGWGARFGAVFEDVGIETKEDCQFYHGSASLMITGISLLNIVSVQRLSTGQDQ